MPFKVKDLMINIGAGEPVGGWLSRFPCGCGCTYGYTIGCPNTGGGGQTPHIFARIGLGEPVGGWLSRFPCGCGCTYGYTIGCPNTGGGGQTPQIFARYFDCQINSNVVGGGHGGGGHTELFGWNPDPVPWALTPGFCPAQTVIGPVGVPPGGDPALSSQLLAALKVQLQQALAEVEKQQEAVDASLQQQTVAQADELLGKLREAVDEVEKRKKELEKQK